MHDRKKGDELAARITDLAKKFYSFEKACYSGKLPEGLNLKMPECKTTTWSSFAEDPKSEVKGYDKKEKKLY